MSIESLVNFIIDGGYVPHYLLRKAIRYNLRQRLADLAVAEESAGGHHAYVQSFVARLKTMPVCVEEDAANEQHYKVGTGVLRGMLGPRMKYSSCFYPRGDETLEQAEEAMLELYVQRADLRDGQKVLDLGCGWGSASLFLAERFPRSRVWAFSNSSTQRDFIESQARAKGLQNLHVVMGNVREYEFEEHLATFDRVVSIEMFEHMKNYKDLMNKIQKSLKIGGKLFVHYFSHSTTPYEFRNDDGWMAQHFFSGGTMPSADLLFLFQEDLVLEKHWVLSGTHYSKTLEAWLARMLENKKAMWPEIEKTYGAANAIMWWNRWQVFYLACSELFNWNGGKTWLVAHFLFVKRP